MGRGDELLDTVDIPDSSQPSKNLANRLELMPTIDRLARRHGVDPSQLGQLYISIGPGSFTGLRIAIATAKALAGVLGVKLVAVPTMEVIAHNAPGPEGNGGADRLAVCLNQKRDAAYTQLFDYHAGRWIPRRQAAVRTMGQLLDEAGRPLTIIGDPAPTIPGDVEDSVTLLDPRLAIGRSDAVWKLGRQLAQEERFIDPMELLPLYARPPEAQELWDKRHGNQSAASLSPVTADRENP